MALKRGHQLFQIALLILAVLCLPLSSLAVTNTDKVQSKQYFIRSIQWEKYGQDKLRIQGQISPVFTIYELFNPTRIIIDIANGNFLTSVTFPLDFTDGPIRSVQGDILKNQEPKIAQLQLILAEDREYSVARDQNDIIIEFGNPKTKDTGQPADINRTEKNHVQAIIKKPIEKRTGETALIATGLIKKKLQPSLASHQQHVISATKPKSVAKQQSATPTDHKKLSSDFDMSFGGYKAQKITVDFYKIDLHNVFRLIGKISERNIVIDEAVNGSLTLALNDVPWDFALDIILNLKNLQKEERSNTIVISPKDKGFTWPENASTNLEIEEDTDPLKVQNRLNISQETFEAKRLIRQARELEKEKKYHNAVELYEKAMSFWPQNSELAGRTATLCLVHLGLNAKAAYLAKKAIVINPENNKAALTAAISLANLKKLQEAREYFDIAINVPQPTKQALASYAAFSEQNQSPKAALNILQQYEDVYGSSLQIMISKARIYDKLQQTELADREYSAALNSGEKIPSALKIFINKRLSKIANTAKPKAELPIRNGR